MSAITGIEPFDVCGPLPTGATVLEASAGTGKTFTIAGLAARYVADGVPLHQLLIVTFTRAATAELRDRVRERLVSTERGLDRALAGVAPDPQDRVLALLADGSRADIRTRHDRLARALADFDAATIVTTHGFCQEVLGGLGIAGDLEPGITFVEDLSDLTEEVVEDLYLRRFLEEKEAPFDLTQARKIAREAVRNPGALIEPAAGAGDKGPVGMRVRLALRVREELESRKRRRGVMTFDDLLTRLNDALLGPSGEPIARRLRERYGVVLIDEFQDTDPVQWNIMRLAFGEGSGSTLVLIGDPKQAIYAFRGADVYAYLKAARTAGASATLDVNWRSDKGLIDAYDRMFGGARLGHEGIVYRTVRAASANETPRLSRAPQSAPLRLRVVPRDEVGTTFGGFAVTDDAREHIAQDLAADVVSLLSSSAEVELRTDEGATAGRVAIAPGHLAVLVRRNKDAELVRDALETAGVPAVLNGAGSVFATSAAHDWLRLLEALERPSYPPRAKAAARTAFLGWTTERIAGASEEEWETIHRRLHGWAYVLRARGVAALVERMTLVERLPRRLLGVVGGERRLTDLRHVAQLLHVAAMEDQMAVAALTGWLRRRIAAAEREGDEERSRRLESDAEAVQVLTIHRSKGLEFPVVYLPYLWHPTWMTGEAVPVTYHDAGDDDTRKLDVGLAGAGYGANKRKALAEQRGEDLRLAYVALTRAKHQAVVWWAGTKNASDSPLGRLLFARAEDGTVAESGGVTPSDAAAVARFEELAAEVPGCIRVERSSLGTPAWWSGPPGAPASLSASSFDRRLDLEWRRTSYSSITAGAHDARVASEPEEGVVEDERSGHAVQSARESLDDEALRSVPSLLADMPAGVEVGTFVHGVLEAADFAAHALEAELAACVARVQARRRVEVGSAAVVVAGLRAALETPLGRVFEGGRLCDVVRVDRLDELVFELPLVGGDEPSADLTLGAIGAVLRRHLPAGDPLSGYASRLEDPVLRQDIRGYLTGSIDLVARLPSATGDPRFAIVDYKTNRLGTPDESLTAWDYRPAALALEMQRSHYVLQALLYTVALHRYLRWRLDGYDASRNLGGVAYLFLRGMSGASTPVVNGARCGVFAWQPSGALVEELSDVLDRGVAS